MSTYPLEVAWMYCKSCGPTDTKSMFMPVISHPALSFAITQSSFGQKKSLPCWRSIVGISQTITTSAFGTVFILRCPLPKPVQITF